jgi:hypothetical protein
MVLDTMAGGMGRCLCPRGEIELAEDGLASQQPGLGPAGTYQSVRLSVVEPLTQ